MINPSPVVLLCIVAVESGWQCKISPEVRGSIPIKTHE